MGTAIVFNGANYTVPAPGDEDWGENTSAFLVAIPQGCLQKTGGAFTLSANVNFGPNYGLLSAHFSSRTANPSGAGLVRLAVTDSIGWRNNANGGNLLLAVNGSDQLTFNGNALTAGGITALTGDVTATGPGSVAATIAANAVTDDKFRQSAGLSVVGTAGNSTANVADITAGTDHYVLRRSGTSLGFGLLLNANIDAAAAIAYSKLALTGSIVNSDISASAAISHSKMATLTASRALVSDGSGIVSVATTTAAEIGFLSGVTSAIQTQIDAKASAAALTAHTGASSGVHGVAGSVVGTTDVQTLTNKTIVGATFSGGVSTGLTLTITDTLLTVADLSDPTKRFQFSAAGIAPGAIRILTVPNANTTLVGTGVTQTLTNKTIDATSNTLLNISNSAIASSAAIDASKIANGSVSNTEFQYLDGVTSSIQAQINAISGGITALTGDVTASGSGSVAATVDFVGGESAANVAAAAVAVQSATDANTADTIVKRDGAGDFSAGVVTAAELNSLDALVIRSRDNISDSGTLNLSSGASAGGNSGDTVLSTGASSSANSGSTSIRTGSSILNSGGINIETGDSAGGNTGAVNVSTGDTFGGDSGDVILSTGVATGVKGKVKVSGTDLAITNEGSGLQIKEGSNAKMGVGTFTGAGAVTIYTTAVTSNSRIFVSSIGGGSPFFVGFLWADTIVPGNSFNVNSSNSSDDNSFNWLIIEPS